MSRYFRKFVFLFGHFGWQSYLILALILMAVAMFTIVLPAKKESILLMQDELRLLVKAHKDRAFNPSSNESFPDKFYAHLPTTAQLKDMQAFFFEVAEAKRLTTDTVDFILDEQPDVSFFSYKMQVPVSGTYLEIMGFVRRMLETYQAVALTNLYLGRDDAQSNLVYGDIEFTAYVKKDN